MNIEFIKKIQNTIKYQNTITVLVGVVAPTGLLANIVFQMSGNFTKCLTYALPQACPGTGGASWMGALFPLFPESQKRFEK